MSEVTITVQGDATVTVEPKDKKKKEESTESKPKLLTEDMPPWEK